MLPWSRAETTDLSRAGENFLAVLFGLVLFVFGPSNSVGTVKSVPLLVLPPTVIQSGRNNGEQTAETLSNPEFIIVYCCLITLRINIPVYQSCVLFRKGPVYRKQLSSVVELGKGCRTFVALSSNVPVAVWSQMNQPYLGSYGTLLDGNYWDDAFHDSGIVQEKQIIDHKYELR